MTLRLRRCVSLFVCLSLLLSACSPDKSSKAGSKVSSKTNEFARNTKVEEVKMTEREKKMRGVATLPPSFCDRHKSCSWVRDKWYARNDEMTKIGGVSITPTGVAIGTVAILGTVAVVGGGVWWLGHKKGWWKKSSTQPPPHGDADLNTLNKGGKGKKGKGTDGALTGTGTDKGGNGHGKGEVQQQGVKGNNADNGKDGKKEKVVLTEEEEREWVLKWVWVQEGVWVEDVAGKVEKCAGNKAVEELRENKNVKFMSLETRAAAAKAGNAVIAREREKTNEKLVEAVVDVEKRLTNTGADETRQVVEDVMKQRSNTERYFDSESDARTVMNAAMISKNPFSLFSSPYEKNDNPNVCSLCSAKNSIWEALHFGEKRIRENIKVQLLGEDWEMHVKEAAKAKPWINGGNWDRKREETLALSEGTDVWVSLKVRAEREPLGKRLQAVMMGLKELVIGAMSEVLEAGEKK